MAKDVVISAENLGKMYVIGHNAERERYTALRDVIARRARTLKRDLTDLISGRPNIEGDEVEEFWALRDVSFEIRRGDVVGVIGRNGAGKSTLLKILSRITEPSTGRVEIRGRVASLLEVGTGFHPELTGRENIFLNGAILGMGRSEIKKKFDEIVAFAEVEKFLDTPVKRYSSGMYVRLAFAVAAHLEPEILVVDEVLAVGDLEFQKKCIGKMSEVANGGRTVLFVSHNMQTIRSLCQSAVLLEKGRVAVRAAVDEVLAAYRDAACRGGETHPAGSRAFAANGRSTYIAECSAEGAWDGSTLVSVSVRTNTATRVAVHFYLKDYLGNAVAFGTIGGLGTALVPLRQGENEVRVVINTGRLASGRYALSIRLDGPQRDELESLDDVLYFENHPPLARGHSEFLRQEWGYGCLHLETSLRDKM